MSFSFVSLRVHQLGDVNDAMVSSLRHLPLALLRVTVVLSIAYVSTPHFCAQAQETSEPSFAGLAWEHCTRQDHCLDSYFCAETKDGLYVGCPIGDAGDDTETFCNCIRIDKNFDCSTSADCASGEICSIQERDNTTQTCVSCFALANNTIFEFEPAFATDTACDQLPSPLPSSSPSPSPAASPPTRAFDFCYGVGDCDDGTYCSIWEDPTEQCSVYSTKCVCEPITPTSCSASSECNEGTVCVTDVYDGVDICVSCTAVAQRANYVPLDEAGNACLKATPVQGPGYPIQLNGASLDLCRSDEMCNGGRTCMYRKETETTSCPADLNNNCICLGSNGLTACLSAGDCEDGLEICGIAVDIPFSVCYSLYLAAALTPVFGKVIGARPTPTVEVPALSGESCRFDWECASPRRCNHITESGRYGECAGRRACRCEPLFDLRCAENDDCESGEACAHIVGARTGPVCRALSAIAADPLYELEEPSSISVPPAASPTSGAESPVPGSPGSRLLGEPCTDGADCTSQLCRHVTENATECVGRPGCRCVPASATASCEQDSDCQSGELCTVVYDQVRYLVPPFCFSAALVRARPDIYVELASADVAPPASPTPAFTRLPPSASPSDSLPPSVSSSPSLPPSSTDSISLGDENVCIHAAALSHLPSDSLVYPTHRRATVLCDADGSCATPGHLVIYNHSPMLMRNYCACCAICSRRVAFVNSPRMRVALRVRSQTRGLLYTALAARFETVAEERLLRALVRVGL